MEGQTAAIDKEQMIKGESKDRIFPPGTGSKEPKIGLDVNPPEGSYQLFFYNYKAINIPEDVHEATLEVYFPNSKEGTQELFDSYTISDEYIDHDKKRIDYKIPQDKYVTRLKKIQESPTFNINKFLGKWSFAIYIDKNWYNTVRFHESLDTKRP